MVDFLETDIISIDNYIKNTNKKDKELVKEFEKEREYLSNLIGKHNDSYIFSPKTIENINEKICKLNEKIANLESETNFNFYTIETHEILENYKKLLEKPNKISFFGKCVKDNSKEEIIKNYIEIASKYYDIENIKKSDRPRAVQPAIFKNICENCNFNDEMDIEDERYICKNCGFQKDILGNMTSYKDINRVNITYKFTYERIVHFKDCINQYQGKQNSTIEEKVFKDLENQFEIHGLLCGGKDTPRIERFKNITKDHIMMFLKETNNSNNYEHVFLIYNIITGKKNDNISHLEKVLLEDFETLSELYDKKFKKEKKINRKSFINAQYVLYHLLRKHKYPCKKEDFNILKTLDRKSFHDEVLSELFQELSWNYTPCF